MKKLIKLFKNPKTYYFLTITILTIVFFHSNFPRFFVSLKAFFYHFIYFLSYDFLVDKTPPLQALDYVINENLFQFFLPYEWDLFQERFLLSFKLLINKDVFNLFGAALGDIAYQLSRLIIFGSILFGAITIAFKSQSFDDKSTPIDSRSLIRFKKLINKLRPYYQSVINFFKNLYESNFIKWYSIILVAYLSNLAPLALDIASELLLICSGGHFDKIFPFIALLLMDLIRFFIVNPLVVVIPVTLYLIHKLRVYHALKVLNKHDENNKKFYESTGNIILFTGASGTGKTTMLVDAVLTLETSIRNDKLLKIIHRQEAKFPNFNWRQLESEIDRLSNNGEIKTRVDLINYVNELYKTFKSTGQLLGYDTKNSKLIVWDELTADSIFNSIKNYATAYFFYRIEKPLSIAATGIYHDLGVSKDKHYFPLYNPNYFSETLDDYLKRIKENYATIIDYNFMRMGNKKTHLDEKGKAMKNDPYLYNIGVIAMPECDKERGSYADLRSMSESDEACNQVNDLFYIYQTIMRHNTELDHEILHKIIMDDQDLMKLNPELRQLVETVITLDRNQRKSYNALFLWWIDETLCEAIIKAYHFINDTRKQYKRNDTLFTYMIRNLVNKVEMYYMRRVNRFGYDKLGLYTTNSSLDDVSNESGKEVLYLSYKKLYSGRFDDVYLKSLFLSIEKNATISINDLARFESITPSVSDFAKQNSFLYDSYFSIFNSGKRR